MVARTMWVEGHSVQKVCDAICRLSLSAARCLSHAMTRAVYSGVPAAVCCGCSFLLLLLECVGSDRANVIATCEWRASHDSACLPLAVASIAAVRTVFCSNVY